MKHFDYFVSLYQNDVVKQVIQELFLNIKQQKQSPNLPLKN